MESVFNLSVLLSKNFNDNYYLINLFVNISAEVRARPSSIASTPTEPSVSLAAIADLQQQLKLLRDGFVPVAQFSALKNENTALRNEVESLREAIVTMRQDFSKRLLNVMEEIDEEKKAKLSMQVEIDRMKKIVKMTSVLESPIK